MKKLWDEFKKFAFKGNVIDMAVGVMIASAFGKIVTSLVNDLFMPLISLLTGGMDVSTLYITLGQGSYATAAEANQMGVATLNYGSFIQTVIDFLLIALCIFVFVKVVNGLMGKKPEAPKEKPRLCPFCMQEVDKKATRCPHCTSILPEPEEQK